MTLESWSMGIVRPVMEVYPYAWAFFVPFIMVTTFAVVNLLVGLIVNSMQDAHAEESNAATDAYRDEVLERLKAIEERLERPVRKAPCTAMVFVWSQLTRGDPNYTLVQVSLNDVIMVFAFAPIVAFLLGVTDIAVPWETLVLSVVLYVVIPLAAGLVTRSWLIGRGGQAAVERFTARIKPASVFGLLATVVLLFGFQGSVILAQPFLIVLLATPILIQSYGIFALAYAWAWVWRVPHSVAAPCALIGTSNFFELAVAVAIGLFGLDSGAALVTVVGVLVEVPVMLSLVAFANRTRARFPA
jgi:ACR3 family arsenite transporter